jgi:hypothetical protein
MTESTFDTPDQEPVDEGSPPVFGSWPGFYAFVLILHGVIILLFYLFTQAYA